MSFPTSGFGGFGSSTNNQTSSLFGSGFGANNNNNNTTQTTTGGFGTPGNTGFGATNNNAGGSLFGSGGNSSGFGSGGFGANNQARPFGTPTTTAGGSLFGSSTNQTSGSGFGGGFGTTANNPSSGFGASGGGLFGQPTQAQTGFGASTGGGLFGANSQPSAFGQPQPSTGAFGQPAGTGFGQTQPQQSQQLAQNNGTGSVPFQPHIEKDGGAGSQQYQSIVCQPPYQNFSLEELRAADYNQGRRYGNQSGQAGAFGQSTGFGGGFGQSTSNTGFGSSTGGGLFGSQQNQGTTAFGQSNTNTTPGFGANSTTTGGLFGAKPTTGGTGMFGSTPNTSSQQTGGLFGTSSGTSGFGQTTGAFGNTGSTGGGLFGNQNQTQQKPGGLFGSANTGAFGQANTGGFGAATSGTGLFGNNGTNQPQSTGFGQTAQTSSPFSGGFGQSQPQNQQQPQTNNPFGAATNNGSSLFGLQQSQQKPGGLFGSSTGSGLFGQTDQQQGQQQPANNLFGNSNNQQNQGGGLFGQNNTQQKSLFGQGQSATNGGGGLFGGSFGNNQQNNQNQGNSLFGQNNNQAKPNLFGSGQSSTGGNSLFGGFGQSNNQQQNQGNSLFGLSNQNQQQQPMSNSLLNNNQQNQPPALQQPQYLTTSITAENPYGNEQLFQSLATPTQSVGPLVTPLSSSQKPRQRTPLPTYRLNPGASSRLLTPQKRNGYGFDYSTYGTPGSAFSNASPAYGASRFLGGSFGRSLGKSASTSNLRASFNEDSILAPGAFSASGLRGGGTGSLKKLKINRTLRTDLFGADNSHDTFHASPLKKRVSFEGAANKKDSQANGESNQDQADSSTALVRVEEGESSQPSAEEQGYLRSSRNKAGNSSIATGRKEMEQVKGNELAIVPEDETPSVPAPPTKSTKQGVVEAARAAHRDMEPGNYFMIPSRVEIEKMSRKDRSNISPFTVGREFTGKIEFEKVDLSNVDLDKIFGDIVRIETRSATVYADHANKPEAGKDMNFPALVTLDNSWPRSKGGKLPIFERKGPRFEKHLERLKRVGHTEFVKYDVETGEWIFRVPHFSTYTFDYSDDESMLSPAPDTPHGGQSGLLPRAARGALASDHEDVSSNNSFEGDDVDDTFEFRNSRQPPGGFDGDVVSEDDMELPNEDDDNGYLDKEEPVASIEPHDSSVFDDGPMQEHSFAAERPVENPVSRPQIGQLISPVKNSPLKPRSILKDSSYGTPWDGTQLYNNNDWAAQLQRTLSPKKQDRQVLRESQGLFPRRISSSKSNSAAFSKDSNPFLTSIDVMNSLFGKSQAEETEELQPFTHENRSKLPHATRNAHDTGRDLSGGRPIETFSTLVQEAPARGIGKFRSVCVIKVKDGVPEAPLPGLVPFSELANTVEDTTAAAQHEKLMWQLAQILFDDVAGEPSHDREGATRRDMLTRFWQNLVTPSAQEQITKLKSERKLSVEELALLQLSHHDVWTATETLSEGKDFRLSTMVPQLGADESNENGIRKMIENLIEEWRKSDTLSEITPAARALYELLAGNACVSSGKGGASENRAETFGISARFGLDWRRSFALRLWYAIPGADPLDAAVKLYARDVDVYRETVRPVPWFVEQKIDTHWEDTHHQDRQDILFGLLKIYALWKNPTDDFLRDRVRLTDVISPQNLAGNPIDKRLPFQLYQSLCSRKILSFSADEDEQNYESDLLTKDYASQLSSKAEHLTDAVFVTLFLSEATARETAVRALLHSHAGYINDDSSSGTFLSLHDELHIPASWIWEAKAVHAKNFLSDDVKQCRFLVNAGELGKAHEVLLQSLAPRCIIEEDRRTLSDVLKTLQPHSKQIKGWKSGAALLQDYIDLLQVAEKGGDAREAIDKAKHMRPALEEMQCDSELFVRVAADEIVKDIETAVMVFRRRLGVGDITGALLGKMPMADDEVLKKAMKSSDGYQRRLREAVN